MSSHDARHEESPAYDDERGTTATRTDQPSDRDTEADGGPVLLPVDVEPEPADHGPDTTPDHAPVTIVDREEDPVEADSRRTDYPTDDASGTSAREDRDNRTDNADFATDSSGVTTDRTAGSDLGDLTDNTDNTDVAADRAEGTDATVGPETETGALKDPVPDTATDAATSAAASSASTGTDTDWQDLQGRFVDDPEGAVREAGAKLEKALSDLRARLETGSTEDLRTAFRRYRDLHAELS
jgi:hypothetical protein